MCALVNGDIWQKEKRDPRRRLCQRSDQQEYKNKPETMSEAVQGQMVFCSTEEERTIEAMVERLEGDEEEFHDRLDPLLSLLAPYIRLDKPAAAAVVLALNTAVETRNQHYSIMSRMEKRLKVARWLVDRVSVCGCCTGVVVKPEEEHTPKTPDSSKEKRWW